MCHKHFFKRKYKKIGLNLRYHNVVFKNFIFLLFKATVALFEICSHYFHELCVFKRTFINYPTRKFLLLFAITTILWYNSKRLKITKISYFLISYEKISIGPFLRDSPDSRTWCVSVCRSRTEFSYKNHSIKLIRGESFHRITRI